MLGDEHGGTYVGWGELLNGGGGEVHVQRLDPDGNALWAANGVVLAGNVTSYWSAFAADGAGGVIAAWQDLRNGSYGDVYAQRVGPDGTVRWTAGGVPVALLGGQTRWVSLVSDGAGARRWSDSTGRARAISVTRTHSASTPAARRSGT